MRARSPHPTWKKYSTLQARGCDEVRVRVTTDKNARVRVRGPRGDTD